MKSEVLQFFLDRGFNRFVILAVRRFGVICAPNELGLQLNFRRLCIQEVHDKIANAAHTQVRALVSLKFALIDYSREFQSSLSAISPSAG